MPVCWRGAMGYASALLLLFALVPATLSAVLPEYLIRMTERSKSTVVGTFYGAADRNELSKVAVQFNLHDHPDGRSIMTLQRPGGGGNLLHFKWSQHADGKTQLDEHRVLDKTFSGTPPPQLTKAERQAEAKAFAQLRQTSAYRLLPLISQTLGERFNVTGWSMRSAFVFHKFALDAEKTHNTLAELQSRTAPLMLLRRRKRFSLDPWSKSDSFDCNSPSGKCSNNLLNYENSGDCNARGTPITPSLYSNGCYGMCGPGCYNCWTYICGDCCAHPGCNQHDGECVSGYFNFDCLTGKGVVWDNDSQWSHNC